MAKLTGISPEDRSRAGLFLFTSCRNTWLPGMVNFMRAVNEHRKYNNQEPFLPVNFENDA